MNKLHELLNRLEADILGGKYPIGSRFPSERQLSERYGVSRITTRDAVSRLCQMGLLRKAPQSGTFVNDYMTEASVELLGRVMQSTEMIDAAFLISLLEFRRVNEVFAARRTAAEIDEKGIDEMEALVAKGLSAEGDMTALCDCDYEIHRSVIRHSGNVILALLFNSFRTIYRHYTEFFYTLPGSAERTMRQYERLVSAFRSRDAEYAAHVMESLLLYAENAVKDAVSYNGGDKIDLKAFRVAGGRG